MDQRDEQDFAQFARAQSSRLFRTAYLLTGDYQHAEDLLQTTLTEVYLRWGRITRMDHPGAYARRILVNGTISRFRRRSVRETPLLSREPEAPDRADAGVESRDVWDAVLTLPERQRAVIVLRYYEGLTETETADVLGIAVGTVKSHAHAATRALATLLVERDGSTSPTGSSS